MNMQEYQNKVKFSNEKMYALVAATIGTYMMEVSTELAQSWALLTALACPESVGQVGSVDYENAKEVLLLARGEWSQLFQFFIETMDNVELKENKEGDLKRFIEELIASSVEIPDELNPNNMKN